ncbi:MAG: tyrosine-type recombinase/integrase [bacterium]
MGLIKRGQKWMIQLRYNGRLVRIATGTSNKKLAQEIEAKTKTELVEGRYFDKGQGNKKTFKDMADKYMTEYAIKKAVRSKLRDGVSLKHLLPEFGDTYLSQITPNQIARYKVKREQEGASPKSINHELGFCKHAFNLAIKEWEWVKDNPFTKVSMEKLPQPRVRYLTPEEFEKLYQACNERLKPIVLLAVNTGMRQDNILSLTWTQIDLSRGVIILEHTKNGERLGLPMNDTVKNLLIELNKVRHINSPYVFHNSTGNRISATTVQHAFHRVCKKAGIQDFRFHDLRHTFASWLVQGGVDLYRVQRLLGHKTGEMTRRYAHLAPDNLRDGVTILDKKPEAITKAITPEL